MIGTCTPRVSSCSTICGTAAAASSLLTVTRTSSEPARASEATCSTVEATSAVSVLVIDCTTTGASEPTRTLPMVQLTVLRRWIEAMWNPKFNRSLGRESQTRLEFYKQREQQRLSRSGTQKTRRTQALWTGGNNQSFSR